MRVVSGMAFGTGAVAAAREDLMTAVDLRCLILDVRNT